MPNNSSGGQWPARPPVGLIGLAALAHVGLALHTRREHFAAHSPGGDQSAVDGPDSEDDHLSWLDALGQLDPEAAGRINPSDPWGHGDLPEGQYSLQAAMESFDPQERADFEQIRAGTGTVVAMSYASGAFSTSCLQGCPGMGPAVTLSYNSMGETTVLGVSNKVVKVYSWVGRMGNNLIQLANVIIYCRATNRTLIILPVFSRHRIPILELPPTIRVRPCDGESCRDPKCHFWEGGSFFGRCDNQLKADYQDIYRKDLLGFASRKTLAECQSQRERAHPHRLTIHLRSGDMMKKKGHFQAQFAPCAFFTRIIRDFGFKRVLVVTEDLRHPCTTQLQKQNPDIKFDAQKSTVVTDAATIMTSRHLAVGSPSTFSQALLLFSKELQDYFVPGKCDCKNERREGVFPRNLWCYDVEGLNRVVEPGPERVRYITNASVPVKLMGVCDDLRAAPFEGSVQALRLSHD